MNHTATSGYVSLSGRDALAKKNGVRRRCHFVAQQITPKLKSKVANRLQSSTERRMLSKSTYEGEWNNNIREGFGTEVINGKERYEGQWRNNKRNGSGSLFTIVHGEFKKRYIGEWRDGELHGHGTYFFPNGDKYEGEWCQGKREGPGNLFYATGDKYEGNWKDDRRHGFGVLTTSNDDRYEGNWSENKKHGSGTYYFRRSQTIYTGEWIDDVAKMGVYQQQPETDADTTTELPRIGLANPDHVAAESKAMLEQEIATSNTSSRHISNIPNSIQSCGLNDEEISELLHAWTVVANDVENSLPVQPDFLAALLRELELEPTPEDLALLMLEMGVEVGNASAPEQRMDFQAFAKCMASHREEA